MIRLGTAGNCEKDILSSLKRLKEFGIDAQEVEFTYGVNMTLDTAKKAGKLAKELGIKLSIHAPFYINLASAEKHKIAASKKRILDSAERGHYLNATHIVFHAAFYGKRTHEETYEMVKQEILDMQLYMEKKKWNTSLAPETTGKASQFGSLDELLKLSKETGCKICIDFAHLRAREGKINYKEVFDKIKHIKHVHAHFSGIEYTAKGERRHLVMNEKDIEPLLKEIIKRKTDITIISESPVTWQDALKMKAVLEHLR
ncbi:MAG: TIM barrel protein [bacterium]|nr:TIM barrel protein [bacterium]